MALSKKCYATKDSLFAYRESGGVNLGGGQDDHLPVGYNPGYRFRSGIVFGLDWTGVKQIVSASLNLKVASQAHMEYGSDPDVYVERATESWTENSYRSSYDSPAGAGWYNATTAWPGPAVTTTGRATWDVNPTEDGWVSVDISDIVEAWAPTTVKKRDGTAGGAASNYGVVLRGVAGDTSTDDTIEFYSRHTANDPYVLIVYSSNTAPTAPTLVKVDGKTTGTSDITDTTPVVTFTGHDADVGDTLSKYDIQIDTTTDNGVAPDWTALAWEAVGGTSGIVDQTVTRTVGTALTSGQWYALRCRTYDAANAQGAWSATFWFRVNAVPTVGTLVPTPGSVAETWNRDATALWTLGGSHAKPVLGFTPADAAGDKITDYEVRIKTSAGGAAVHTADKDNSTPSTALPWTQGVARTVKVNYAILNETTYYWDVRVQDENGTWSNYSGEQTFMVRWGQARYSFQPGATSSNWTWSTGPVNATDQGDASFLFGSASTSTGTPGTWYADIAAAEAAKGTNGWMHVAVRLTAWGVSICTAELTSMRFTYLGAASTPNHWQASGAAGTWTLDSAVRRYGSRSFRCRTDGVTSGNTYVIPYRMTTGDDVPVLPNTSYTFSGWIKTQAAMTNPVRLRLYQAGANTVLRASSAALYDSAAEEGSQDGWVRLSVTYTTLSNEYLIRPMVHYNQGTLASDTFWVDALKLEEGPIATAWSPGYVGQAVVLDAQGVVVDGTAGGTFRMRGSGGTTRDTVELGANGLIVGGDTVIQSPATDELRVGLVDTGGPAKLHVSGDVTTGQPGGELRLDGGGVNRDYWLRNENTVLYVGSTSLNDSVALDDSGGTSPPGSLVDTGAAQLVVGGYVDAVRDGAASRSMFRGFIGPTDTQPAIQLSVDASSRPQIQLGAGGSTAEDITLYRLAANELALGAGDMLTANVPGAAYEAGAAQTIAAAGTSTNLGWGTKLYDTGDSYNATNRYWLVPSGKGGLYLIAGSCNVVNQTAGSANHTRWFLFKGGVEQPGILAQVHGTAGTNASQTFARLVVLAAGNTVSIRAGVFGAQADVSLTAIQIVRLHADGFMT